MRVTEQPARTFRDDKGSVLAGVIGVFAVTILLATLVASSTVYAIGFTSATRAGVQSQAAADAGISFAVAEMMKGNCQREYSDEDAAAVLGVAALDVNFDVQIMSRPAAASTWPDGCPVADSVQVRIVSTGAAFAPGVVGHERGDTRRVEAIFAAAPSNSEIQATGAAIYSFSSAGFGGSSQVLSVDGSKPFVQVKHGDAICNGSVIVSTDLTVSSDLIVADGALEVNGSCQVTGNVWTSEGTTVAGSGQVGGNVTTAVLHLSGSAIIHGDAWSSGAASLGASTSIGGHLTAKSVTGGGSTAGGRTITEPAEPGPGPTPKSAIVGPDWVDFSYEATDWTGFHATTIASECDFTAVKAAADSLATAPGIIDARGCSAGVHMIGSEKLVLQNDLVIVANSFAFGNSAQFNSSTEVNLWLITPDETDDGEPTCLSGGGSAVGESFIAGTQVTAMLYSPCGVTLGGSAQWRGQVYSGTVSIGGSAILHYVPIGLPGVNLSTGDSSDGTGDSGSSLLGQRISIRDLSSRD